MNYDLKFQDRLWAKIVIAPGCWEWTAGVSKEGCPFIRLEDKVLSVRRVVWEIMKREVPKGKLYHPHPGDIQNTQHCVRPEHCQEGNCH